jgi:hypothetical protein
MSFLEHFQPSVKPLRVYQQRRRHPHFHGGMSLRCLLDAAQHGTAALLTYLLVWHVRLLKKQDWVELTGETCALAGLSEHRRQTAVRHLAHGTSLLEVAHRVGQPTLARPMDPWLGSPYFMGYMSFECLKRAAASQPNGKALAVYVLTWHEFNLAKRGTPIRLGQRQREMLGLRRSSWNRAVNKLQAAGLLEIYSQQAGASPLAIPLDPWRPDFTTDATRCLASEDRWGQAPPALARAAVASHSSAG